MPVPVEKLGRRGGEPSNDVLNRVSSAREIQRLRYDSNPGVHSNAQMSPSDEDRFCRLTRSGRSLISDAVSSLGLSARGFTRVLRVGRTIADLCQSEEVLEEHLAEAIQYRSLDRSRLAL
ncbi:MAG: hypothetical protein HKN13_06105 [Rhodothermales bacterium]|nr:hypothetical protein [Rhodothermales bacterium]